MAHLVTGYAGKAHIRSADDGAFNASFFGGDQYVMEFGNRFAGSIIDNNTVRILDGEGLMYGRHFRIEPNSYEDLTITTGTAETNRIDLVCMTYEKNASDETERCYLQVVKGTETSGTAVAPEYTDGNILEGAAFNQMPLYKVLIEGVVLSEIVPLFETLPSHKQLASWYAKNFDAICEEVKESIGIDEVIHQEDVIDNLTSEETKKPLSANQGMILQEKINKQNENLNVRYNLENDTLQIYHNGEWHDWQSATAQNLLLYDNGEVNTEIIGGFTALSYRPSDSESNTNFPSVVQESNNMSLYLMDSATVGVVATNKPVDLTEYNTIRLKCNLATANEFYFSTTKTLKNGYVVGNQIVMNDKSGYLDTELDVSNLTGEHYLLFLLYKTDADIYSIELIK